MKNRLLIIIFSISIAGCASIELGDALSSQQHTQKILALGLSHEENLVEASKLNTPHLVSVVSLQLTNARDEKIQNEIDLIESETFANQVVTSNNGLRFSGPELSESVKTGILATDSDLHTYYLEGNKMDNSEKILHKLHLIVSHNSRGKREYLGANLCDKWGRCEDLKEDGSNNKLDLKVVSTNASNCNTNSCNYTEILEVKFADNLLKDSVDNGLNFKLISKKKTHKVKISKPYLMGYLNVAK